MMLWGIGIVTLGSVFWWCFEVDVECQDGAQKGENLNMFFGFNNQPRLRKGQESNIIISNIIISPLPLPDAGTTAQKLLGAYVLVPIQFRQPGPAGGGDTARAEVLECLPAVAAPGNCNSMPAPRQRGRDETEPLVTSQGIASFKSAWAPSTQHKHPRFHHPPALSQASSRPRRARSVPFPRTMPRSRCTCHL